MIWSRSRAIGVGVLLTVFGRDIIAGESAQWTATPIGRSCGVYCAAIALARATNTEPMPFRDVERAVDANGDGLSSALEIVEYLRVHGLKPVALQEPLGRKAIPRRLSILRVRASPSVQEGGGHFIVVEPTSAGQLLVYDLPRGYGLANDRELLEAWDGFWVDVSPEQQGGLAALGCAMLGFGLGIGFDMLYRRLRRIA
jgi:hypothetical protein